MPFIVGDGCINCKLGDCVEVCPVDCFYEGENMLVINPDECIDCALCVPECPENAIFADDEVPSDQLEFINLNRMLSQRWDNITEKCEPPADHEKWSGVANKLKHLIK